MKQPRNPTDSLADDIAFGAEQTLLCFSTDAFTDPLIADKLQRSLQPQITHNHLPHGNKVENMIAEGAGDLFGFAAFVAARQLFRPAFDVARHVVRKTLDPFYDKVARERLHISSKQPLSTQETHQLNDIKNFEADTFVKSNTISVLSTLGNVSVMKMRHSAYSLPVLLVSKFAATTVTTATMIGLRLLFPKATRYVDHTLDHYVVKPGLHMIGVKSPNLDSDIHMSLAQEVQEHGLWQERLKQEEKEPDQQQTVGLRN